MSWLNNSLNTIKGQLTTLAQEVLADPSLPNDDDIEGSSSPVDPITALEVLSETQRQCDELNQICLKKDNEIANLRKQITELQNKISEDGAYNNVTGGLPKLPITKNVSLEDSWCWEPENAPTTFPEQSTKNENDHTSESSSISPEIIEMTQEDVRLGEKKRNRLLLDRSNKENTLLQQKILQLEEEKFQLNASLDELDNQHNLAVQNIIELKTELQKKLNSVTKEYEAFKTDHESKVSQQEKTLQAVKKELETLQAAHNTVVAENANLKNDVSICVEKLNATKEELNQLQSLLEKKDKDNIELVERVKSSKASAEEANESLLSLQKQFEVNAKELESLKLEKKCSESSSGKQSVDDEFIVVTSGEGGSSSATPPTKEELKDKIVSLENRLSELTLENGSYALKLQHSEIEHELTVSTLKENLEEMQKKWSASEEKLENFSNEEINFRENLEKVHKEKDEMENEVQKVHQENEKLLLELERVKKTDQEIAIEQNSRIETLLDDNKKLKMQLEEFQTSKHNKSIATEEKEEFDLLKNANDKVSEHESVMNRLKEENQKLKQEIEILLESKENASEVQLKLVQENDVLLKKLTELEPNMDSDNQITQQLELESDTSSISYSDLRGLISTYCNIDLQNNTLLSLEDSLRTIRDKLWKIVVLEKNLTQMSEEILDLQDSKLVWDHDKKTLEADIAQYIVQCDELMKNNEILLNELDNYKRNKLETIHENNEENLIVLETQLEECTKLNRTIEQDCRELNDKIRELELEKQQNLNQLKSAQDQNEQLSKEMEKTRSQLEMLEAEKSNFIFEINELKADDRNNESVEINEELKTALAKVSSLENQLERLNKDHQDLVSKMQEQKIAFTEAERENDELKHKLSEIEEMQKTADSLQNEREDYLSRIAKLEADLLATIDLNKTIASLEFEKNELIKTLQSKHSENMQYYMEIGRLSQLLQEQQQFSTESKLCDNCAAHNENIAQMNKQIEKLEDQVNFLKEKSDILTTNLLTEQTNQKLLHEDKQELVEQNANMKKDLDRLREHLIELEKTHTQETVEMQRELEETNAAMMELKNEISKSSNAYTSASIRANQHTETLQNQYILVTQQRDELLSKLSLAEDRESKNQAALCNLQCALEQFQNDKDKDIQTATQRMRKEFQEEVDKQTQLRYEISLLGQQLAEAKQGLRAASRLSDQLESSQQSIAALREEIECLRKQNALLQEKLHRSESSQTDKIEKNLIKSLLIGYIVSESVNDKNQVLRLISSVLDFTQMESDKVGIHKQQIGWFGSLMGSAGGANGEDGKGFQSKENLVQAFVHFLEQESQPRSTSHHMPNLLNLGSARKNSTDQQQGPSTAKNIAMGSIPVEPILPNSTVIDEFAPSRNSSSILKDILSDS